MTYTEENHFSLLLSDFRFLHLRGLHNTSTMAAMLSGLFLTLQPPDSYSTKLWLIIIVCLKSWNIWFTILSFPTMIIYVHSMKLIMSLWQRWSLLWSINVHLKTTNVVIDFPTGSATNVQDSPLKYLLSVQLTCYGVSTLRINM